MNQYGIVALAFGLPDTISSNVEIGRETADASRRYCAAIFTQHGVMVPHVQSTVTYMHEDEPGSPTLRITRAAVSWAVAHGITTLVIVCATPHAKRCMRDMHVAIDESGITMNLILDSAAASIPEGVWFSPDSTQERTRTKASWKRRELILLYMPLWLYKRVAA